jgi:hypothetical protein
MKKSMIRSAIVFASLLVVALASGCAHAPKPPVGHLCGINAQSSYILCFDFEKDFDADGKLKSSSKGVRSTITLTDLHKGWFIDAPSKEALQAYAMKWKQRFQDLEKSCK